MDTRRTKTPHHPHMKPASYAEEHDGAVFPVPYIDEPLPELFPENGEDIEDGVGEEGRPTEVEPRKPKEKGKGGALEGMKKAITSSVTGALGLFR